jgi:NADH dehydrogenase
LTINCRGGPTGVELAGMFAEMKNDILRKEYPSLSGKGGEIYLVDALNSVLAAMSSASQGTRNINKLV